MKIVFLTIDTNPKNGGGRLAHDLITGIRKAGHHVVILKEENDGLEGIPVLKRGLGMISSAIKIRKYLKDCDIVHAFDIYPQGIIACLAGMFLRKKIVISILGTYSIAPFYNIKTKYLSKIACNSADAIIAISNYTKNEFFGRAKARRMDVINPGIDFDKFYGKRSQTVGEDYILSVGALKFRKGYHVSIPAFALAKKQLPNLKYKIVGSQKDKNYFSKLKGVEGVEFLQNIFDNELRDLYSKARAFVLTSVNQGHHFEGFGLVFLEAAAAGLPVIGTSGNGIADAVGRDNGILVSQGDVEMTSRALVTILSDHDLYQRMSQASYEWAKEHDLNNMVDKYLSIYNQILK